jgi:hypothetical protein
VAAKQVVPFEDEYNQGQLSQHISKLTKPETPITIRIVLILSIKCLLRDTMEELPEKAEMNC